MPNTPLQSDTTCYFLQILHFFFHDLWVISALPYPFNYTISQVSLLSQHDIVLQICIYINH